MFGRNPEDDNDEEIDLDDCNEELVERTYTLNFIRKTQRFTFIRGGEEEITWDTPSEDHPRMDGIKQTKRGNVQVERFQKIIGGDSIPRYDGEIVIRPETTITDEVTSINVAHRGDVQEVEMQLVAECYHTRYLHPETGEEVKVSPFPELDGRSFCIEEA